MGENKEPFWSISTLPWEHKNNKAQKTPTLSVSKSFEAEFSFQLLTNNSKSTQCKAFSHLFIKIASAAVVSGNFSRWARDETWAITSLLLNFFCRNFLRLYKSSFFKDSAIVSSWFASKIRRCSYCNQRGSLRSDHFSVNFRYVRISHLSAVFQSFILIKQLVKSLD